MFVPLVLKWILWCIEKVSAKRSVLSLQVWSSGIGSRGQLGHGDLLPRDELCKVSALTLNDGVAMRIHVKQVRSFVCRMFVCLLVVLFKLVVVTRPLVTVVHCMKHGKMLLIRYMFTSRNGIRYCSNHSEIENCFDIELVMLLKSAKAFCKSMRKRIWISFTKLFSVVVSSSAETKSIRFELKACEAYISLCMDGEKATQNLTCLVDKNYCLLRFSYWRELLIEKF